MKRVRINIGKIGLVYHKGDYKGVITSGTHWLGWNDTIIIQEQSVLYKSDRSLNFILQDANAVSKLEVIEVGDGELALHYEKQKLQDRPYIRKILTGKA